MQLRKISCQLNPSSFIYTGSMRVGRLELDLCSLFLDYYYGPKKRNIRVEKDMNSTIQWKANSYPLLEFLVLAFCLTFIQLMTIFEIGQDIEK